MYTQRRLTQLYIYLFSCVRRRCVYILLLTKTQRDVLYEKKTFLKGVKKKLPLSMPWSNKGGVKLHSCLTSAQDGDEWSASSPGDNPDTQWKEVHGQDDPRPVSRQGKKRVFSSPKRPDCLWGPPGPPSKWGTDVVYRGAKLSGCDVDRSTPADVKEWSYNSTPLIRLHGMDRDFTQKAHNKMISTTCTIHIIIDVRKFHLKQYICNQTRYTIFDD